jgi:hypothetical protein
MFTLFHVFELVGALVGFFSGLAFGQKAFGWIGAIVGAGTGFYCGLVLGRLPYAIVSTRLKRKLKRSDTATLKQRLEKEYFISHLIIACLVVRGEPVEQFRDYVFSLLHSDLSDKRQFGWRNLQIWFPELAQRVGDFNPMNSTEICKEKLKTILI